MQDVFTKYFETNFRADKESVSGPGSNSEQTKVIVQRLPGFLDEYKIKSMLDIPCGDCNWIKNIVRPNISYIGADIVVELVEQNTKKYPIGFFEVLDITKDKLPKVDLIMVRDCLVHFADDDIFKALHNICNSGSKYILLTCFPKHSSNKEIETGSRHTINFEQAPFNFPNPIATINEACTEGGGIYSDKSLCLWEIKDIQSVLSKK